MVEDDVEEHVKGGAPCVQVATESEVAQKLNRGSAEALEEVRENKN